MTEQEITDAKTKANEKAIELGATLKKKVHTIFVEKADRDGSNYELIVGYLTEPTLSVKMAVINFIGQKQIDLAGDLILTACLVKDQSDSRLIKPSSDDDVYISAVMSCNSLVNIYASDIKKN